MLSSHPQLDIPSTIYRSISLHIKTRTDRKSTTLSNDMGKGWHIEKIEEQCRIKVFGIADMNFGVGYMNSYTPDAVYVHL